MSKDDEAPRSKKESWFETIMDLSMQPAWDGFSYFVTGVVRLVGSVLAAVLELLP